MTSVIKKLSLSLLCSAFLVLGLAGCSSNEPQGFMVGDKEGLGHGIPAPETPAAETPVTPPGAPASGEPAKQPAESGDPAPSQGEAKNSLGYTPDAEGAQSGQPASK